MEYLAGSKEIVESMPKLHSREPFTPAILEFCDDIAKELMRVPNGRNYPDMITLGFWLRKWQKDQRDSLRKEQRQEKKKLKVSKDEFHACKV